MNAQPQADGAKPDDLLVFPPGAPIQLPEGFPPLPMNVYSEFGFKLVTIQKDGCAGVRVWTAATEEDYRALLARRRNVRPEEVVLSPSSGPGGRCHLWNGACTGNCASTQFCWPIVDLGRGTIGCGCS